MTLDEQNDLQQAVHETFRMMKMYLVEIENNISGYHVHRPLGFQKFILGVLQEAWIDSINKEDDYLNDETDLPSLTI